MSLIKGEFVASEIDAQKFQSEEQKEVTEYDTITTNTNRLFDMPVGEYYRGNCDKIYEKFHAKRDIQEVSIRSLEDTLYLPVLNLATFLKVRQHDKISDWVLLNQTCLEYFGHKSGGIRSIIKNKRNPLYQQLADKIPFLVMTQDDLNLI